MKNKLNKLYFIQWKECGEDNHLQYKTDNLLKVLKKLGNDTGQELNFLGTYKSGVLMAEFEYVTYFISTDMKELIDCEALI